MDYISYGKQNISSDDIDEVVKVLKSDFLTTGPKVKEFETKIASYCNAQYAVAANSATSSLHVACLALGVGVGDLVWSSPITFLASLNCARFCGANVDFVDIDPQTYNLSPQKLKEKLIIAKRERKLPKVVIPVHLAGQSCDMSAIHELSKEFGFKIIEDASHAIGGTYQGKPVGDCRYSDISVFSFHPVKIITTGEGGVATTNSFELAQKMRLYTSHYMTRDESLMVSSSEGPWYYQQLDLGFNYRMTDIQAALGVSQMNRLDTFVKRRHEIVNIYNEAFSDSNVVTPYQDNQTYSSFHLYIIKVKNRLEVFNQLASENIGVNVHYIPVHLQPYYRNWGFKKGDFPCAENYYEEAITIPLFPHMTNQQIDYVISKVLEATR